MAQTIIRLRRTLSLSSNILSHIRLTPTTITTNALLSPASPPINPSHHHFHTTHRLSYKDAVARPTKSFSDMEKIDPDTVLFEGCDYKHWLIVMSFGKDPSQHPPREEMIDTYVRTCAQVLGSIEEAKKKIYACSTTTYTGFQVEVDEETSQKFEGLPGVTFVLPDSYIDPVNKEYGGDKYNNGEIIPRPPPVRYGRPTRLSNPRHRDQMTNQQGNTGYIPQGPVRRDGERHMSHGSPQDFRQQPNYPSQQTNPSQQHYPPQQNYGSYGQGERGNPMPSGTHHSGGVHDGVQVGWTSDVPPHQGNHNNGHNYPQGQMSSPSGPQDGYITQGQFSNYSGGQGQMGNRPINHGYNSHQTVVSNHPGNHGGYTPKGQMDIAGDNRNYSSSPGVGAYGHSGTGTYGPGPDGSYSQGAGTGFGGGHMSSGENQRFPQTSYQQSNTWEHRNYMPGAQTGVDQGRN